ncbi:hypothetical protein NEIELOOT_01279 [Neisseria elongata subsp. glycolytica ATCC 29315]|uniref:Uncharacterized protein n=1 Tax=Neisseria elongata subsp. glycolytica ATCC 29315 TaxID=546263 RepID=D4DQE3_NEIEG|nr:hypothetical protein NEIELOOT_01279 [Neisseria elongata subsp. glycolytica ATCC 29315]
MLRHPILRSTQQHIATLPPLKPPQITPIFGKNAKFTLFSPQNPSKNGDTNTFPKQKICPMECTGNCATFLRPCSTTSVSRSLCR